MKLQLHHVGFAVVDVDATVETLIEAFGGERVATPELGHAVVRLGELQLALVPRRDEDPKERARGDHLALTLDAQARAEALSRLEARGWQWQEVGKRAYVRSSDGFLTLELL